MCSCTTDADAVREQATPTGRSYLVTGMTCQPCATKVTQAVERVEGVTGVTVDLVTGRLTVSGSPTDDAIHGAVTGVDYQISTL